MLVDENSFRRVAVSCLSFSYTDEYDETYQDTGKEDDFEASDDKVLNTFDDDIYGDELDEDDRSITEEDYSRKNDFGDEIYEDISDSEDID